MRKKTIPPYRVVNWDFNQDKIEFYDIMPHFVYEWDKDKKRRHKLWVHEDSSLKLDNTKMPETFEEFKLFVKYNSMTFWGRCEYEVIVHGWPVRKNDYKMDIHEQIMANLDVFTKHFMDYVKG